MALEQLGPYKVVKVLGHGGMGAVYQGVHRDTGEVVALKVLAAPLAADDGFRERFASEIDTLRKLNHPNIVRLLGFGQEAGHLYYVMEVVDGGSLEQEVRRGRNFPWREVVQIGLAMCRALRHAHDRGVIHRDIKPGNVLFAADGTAKLSDFGIARLFGQARLTGPGSVLGTAEYMAPEQAAAGLVDVRADLYSLGCVLYTLLTRRAPFEASSLPEVLHLLQTADPPPIALAAPDTPVALQAVVRQLLHKAPEERFATAVALGHRLQAILDDPDPPTSAELTADKALPSTSPMTSSDWLPPSKPRPFTVADAAVPKASAVEPLPPGERPTTDHRLPPPLAPPAQFVRVARQELDVPAPERDARAWSSIHTWILAAGLCAMGWLLWHFLRPLDADALYGRIAARMTDAEAFELTDSDARNFDEFLTRFADDPRAAEIRRFKLEIELQDLDRQYVKQAGGKRGKEKLLPVERDYLAALQVERLDPEGSAAQLQAVLDLYASRAGNSPQADRCLTLVGKRLQRLRSEIQAQAQPRLAIVREQLAQADEWVARDPNRARQIWQAITVLYGDKPWAATEVARARAGLARVHASTPATSASPTFPSLPKGP